MYRQSDKKREEANRSKDTGQTNITNFFAKKPEPARPIYSQVATRDFAAAYSNATRNVIAPLSGYQPHGSNPDMHRSASSLSASSTTSKYFGQDRPRVFNSVAAAPRPNSTMSKTNMSSLTQSYSAAYNNTKGMSKPPPRGGPLTGNGSGVYVVSKKPTAAKQGESMLTQLASARKRAAPWGPKDPETIRFNNPAPPQSNPFRKNSALSTKSKNQVSRSQLSPCQLKVVDAIFNRKSNVFFTGSAGTGKSFLLRYIISELRQEQEGDAANPRKKPSFFGSRGGEGLLPDSLAITASTGIAAFQLGGTTVHSFAGIGLGQGTLASLVTKVTNNRKTLARWRGLKYLIIDEISMLEGDLFTKLDQLARALRRNTKPFGGIQLILAGDFFQLPPVSRGEVSSFCFESASWKECVTEIIVLDKIFRQRDPEFSAILNEARVGNLSAKAIQTFMSLSRPVQYPNDGIQATEIYSTRREVDDSNNRRLATLGGETVRLEAKDTGKDQYALSALENQTMFPKVLDLKLNAQVMLVKNLTQKHSALVNGSLGIVTGFVDASAEEIDDDTKGRKFGEKSAPSQPTRAGAAQLYPRVRFTSGVELIITPEETTLERHNVVVATRHQVPLILAWALSIHKAQGQTLERLKVDLSKVFEKGQAYVALSRATSLQTLQVLSFNPSKVIAHPKVAEFYRSCMANP